MPDNKAIAAQYENNAIYVILSSRGAGSGFHWGIFLPTASPEGYVWHATNREGGWKLEHKKSKQVPFSLTLILSYKVGTVNGDTWDACFNALNSVPAAGQPSVNTQERFCCRIWVKDALQALDNNRVIALTMGICGYREGS
ncbi:hypothetical protein MMC24_005322 [Lignoscripta atroalba]|nr:hypothetical protein [Lignoscripta atroalba]